MSDLGKAAPGGAPSRAQLAAARGVTVPDLVGPGMRVLLVGINPSLWSGVVGYHFARPTNRLWRTLHEAGFTSRRLPPGDTDALLRAGLGVTNLVPGATARADEVSAAELRRGLPRVRELAARWRPTWIAFLGLSAYRVAAGAPRAAVGAQPTGLAAAGVWLLPNPSGLNASYQQPALTAAYRQLYAAAYDDGRATPVGEPPGRAVDQRP